MITQQAVVRLHVHARAPRDDVAHEREVLVPPLEHRFDVKRHFLKAAILAALLFALYYANWAYRWITPEDLDFYNPPQAAQPNA